jgi:acetyl esterase/lipase
VGVGVGAGLRVAVVLAGCAAALAACTATAPTAEPGTSGPPAASPSPWTPPEPELHGLDTADSPATVVVLVPGGGWASADPAGLVPLAEWLADRGAVVATTTYRTAGQQTYFPTPAEDVACATARTVALVHEAGVEVGEVVLVGHSAGAQLAALVGLTGTTFADGCPDAPVAADRVVGLAGPYDVVAASGYATNLFGPDLPDPADWAPGNPVTYAGDRQDLPVLLVHGRKDTTVPPSATTEFARQLEAGGHDVVTAFPADADHLTVFGPDVAGPLIAQWLGLTP